MNITPDITQFCIENGMMPFDIDTFTLYKYVNIDTAKKIIGNSSLKFSVADEFNDPFELTTRGLDFTTSEKDVKQLISRTVSGTRQERRQLFKEKIKNKSFLEKQMPFLVDTMLKSMGICCFSRKFDKTLMWSHYASNHYGVCLGFKGFFTSSNFLILNVQYIKKIEKVPFWKYKLICVPIVVFRKSDIWSYEEEVRAVHTERHGLLKFEPTCLTEIHYGLKTKPSDIADIEKLIAKYGYNTQSYRMVMNPDTYDIVRQEIVR